MPDEAFVVSLSAAGCGDSQQVEHFPEVGAAARLGMGGEYFQLENLAAAAGNAYVCEVVRSCCAGWRHVVLKTVAL